MLFCVQRPITHVWKQLLGQVVFSNPQVISFHLSPRSPGLSKSNSEKVTSEVGYPNTKLDIIISQIFTANKECPSKPAQFIKFILK